MLDLAATRTADILAELRSVLGAVVSIAERLPLDDDDGGVLLAHRAEALAERMGQLAERESARAADAYNAKWEARRDAALLAAASVPVPTLPPGEPTRQQALLAKYYSSRAALAGAPACYLHDWIPAPPSVAAAKVCTRCSAESAHSLRVGRPEK